MRQKKSVQTPLLDSSAATVQPEYLNDLHIARQGLSLLRRANQGHLHALHRILGLTYGRCGKRRHQLLAPLLAPEIPADHTAVAALSASSRTSTVDELPPRLKALMHSQNRQGGLELFKSRIRINQVEPQIPETNIWGRPTPMKRARNLKKTWLRNVLERLLPPLPEQEWERLRDLANGGQAWEGPIKRRAWPKGASSRWGKECLGEKMPFEDQLTLSTLPFHNRSIGNPHLMNARFMQRLWARIFSQCPVMRWDSMNKSWRVEWGSVNSTGSLEPPQISHLKSEIFAGVDEMGRVLRRSQDVEPSKIVTDFLSDRAGNIRMASTRDLR